MIDQIKNILNYINEHPDKDKILSDLRMTDTNDFQKLLSDVESGELLDGADNYIHYDDIESNGYISDSDHDDKLDEIRLLLNDLIDDVNEATMLDTAKENLLEQIKKIDKCL